MGLFLIYPCEETYERDDPRGVHPEHVGKLQNILTRLEVAQGPEDMNLPGFRLHQLKGDRSGSWAVTVRANWRITFRFERADVADVNYEDYH
ncbi:MAG: type II toxin-antitoxin system RelE/ParE family toxin [bacterium]|nr:type II toxin-antitoxin system RelE/ParE family toxin [bacterium]